VESDGGDIGVPRQVVRRVERVRAAEGDERWPVASAAPRSDEPRRELPGGPAAARPRSHRLRDLVPAAPPRAPSLDCCLLRNARPRPPAARQLADQLPLGVLPAFLLVDRAAERGDLVAGARDLELSALPRLIELPHPQRRLLEFATESCDLGVPCFELLLGRFVRLAGLPQLRIGPLEPGRVRLELDHEPGVRPTDGRELLRARRKEPCAPVELAALRLAVAPDGVQLRLLPGRCRHARRELGAQARDLVGEACGFSVQQRHGVLVGSTVPLEFGRGGRSCFARLFSLRRHSLPVGFDVAPAAQVGFREQRPEKRVRVRQLGADPVECVEVGIVAGRSRQGDGVRVLHPAAHVGAGVEVGRVEVMVAPAGRNELLDGRMRDVRQAGPDQPEFAGDAPRLALPIAEERLVRDEHAREVTGAVLRLEHVPEPQEQRLRPSELVARLQRRSDFEWVADRHHDGRRHPDLRQGVAPDGKDSAQPRILDHERTRAVELAAHDFDGVAAERGGGGSGKGVVGKPQRVVEGAADPGEEGVVRRYHALWFPVAERVVRARGVQLGREVEPEQVEDARDGRGPAAMHAGDEDGVPGRLQRRHGRRLWPGHRSHPRPRERAE
jgi:hypothetical protein